MQGSETIKSMSGKTKGARGLNLVLEVLKMVFVKITEVLCRIVSNMRVLNLTNIRKTLEEEILTRSLEDRLDFQFQKVQIIDFHVCKKVFVKKKIRK
jgi:hypothetical protein